MTVTHHNSKRRMVSSLQGRGRDQMSYEILETHCSNILASGETRVIMRAVGVGRGGSVRLQNFNVEGVVSRYSSMSLLSRVNCYPSNNCKLLHGGSGIRICATKKV